MKTKNFTVVSGIYISTGEWELDLHNNYDFRSMQYDVDARTVLFSWIKSTENWAPADEPRCLALRFEDVRMVEVTRRDPSMPFTEDDCLSDISYSCDEEWCTEPFSTDKTPEDSWYWVFSFMSGASIVLDAGHVEALTEPEQGAEGDAVNRAP